MAVVNNKIESIYPLTPLQEGMLFYNIVDSSLSAYVVQMSYDINKKLSGDLITKALLLLSSKYLVLRTFFAHEKVSKPCQVVLKERELDYEYISRSEERR